MRAVAQGRPPARGTRSAIRRAMARLRCPVCSASSTTPSAAAASARLQRGTRGKRERPACTSCTPQLGSHTCPDFGADQGQGIEVGVRRPAASNRVCPSRSGMPYPSQLLFPDDRDGQPVPGGDMGDVVEHRTAPDQHGNVGGHNPRGQSITVEPVVGQGGESPRAGRPQVSTIDRQGVDRPGVDRPHAAEVGPHRRALRRDLDDGVAAGTGIGDIVRYAPFGEAVELGAADAAGAEHRDVPYSGNRLPFTSRP